MEAVAKRAAYGLYALAVAALVLAGYTRPEFGWDGLAYTAIVLKWQGEGPNARQHDAYAQARVLLSPQKYAALTGEDGSKDADYRRRVHTDAGAFAQQLPFYEVRPLYLGLAALLSAAGVMPAAALIAISLGAYAFVAGLLLVWLSRHLRWPYATLFALLLSLSPPLLLAARTSTPDMLSAALLLTAFYFLVELRRACATMAVLAAAILVRYDNAVFAGLLAAYLILAAPPPLRLALRGALSAGAMLIASVGVAVDLSHHYGWETVFTHTFVHLLAYPADTPAHVSLQVYAHAFVAGLRSLFDSTLLPFLFVGALAYALESARVGTVLYDALLRLVGLTVLVRYLLFPILWDRFLVAYYMAAAVILILKSSIARDAAALPASRAVPATPDAARGGVPSPPYPAQKPRKFPAFFHRRTPSR